MPLNRKKRSSCQLKVRFNLLERYCILPWIHGMSRLDTFLSPPTKSSDKSFSPFFNSVTLCALYCCNDQSYTDTHACWKYEMNSRMASQCSIVHLCKTSRGTKSSDFASKVTRKGNVADQTMPRPVSEEHSDGEFPSTNLHPGLQGVGYEDL